MTAVPQLRDPDRGAGRRGVGSFLRGPRVDRGILGLADVLRRAVAAHRAVVRLVADGIAPLGPLLEGEHHVLVLERLERVHQRCPRHQRPEPLGGTVGRGADQQRTRAEAHGAEPVLGRPAGRDQVVRAGHEVVEGVRLRQPAALPVPFRTHLAAAAHMRDRDDHAVLGEGQGFRSQARIGRAGEGAVPVQDAGGGAVGRHVTAGEQRDRHLRAVCRGGPQPPLDVPPSVETRRDGGEQRTAGAGGEIVLEDLGRGHEAVPAIAQRALAPRSGWARAGSRRARRRARPPGCARDRGSRRLGGG